MPNAPHTVFRLASVSKQFAAAAILLLQERGKLKTSDRLCQHSGGPCNGHRAEQQRTRLMAAGCMTLAGLGLGLGVMAPTVQAALVYTNVGGVVITPGTALEMNLHAGTFGATTPGAEYALYFHFDIPTIPNFVGHDRVIGVHQGVAKLAAGTVVGAASNFTSTGSPLVGDRLQEGGFGDWIGGGEGYIGVRVNGDYGWIHLLCDDVNHELTVHDFAIETDDGVSIVALSTNSGPTPMPEPATPMLLLGSALVMFGARFQSQRGRRKAVVPRIGS